MYVKRLALYLLAAIAVAATRRPIVSRLLRRHGALAVFLAVGHRWVRGSLVLRCEDTREPSAVI